MTELSHHNKDDDTAGADANLGNLVADQLHLDPTVARIQAYFKVAWILFCLAVAAGAVAYLISPLIAAKIVVSCIFLLLATLSLAVVFMQRSLLVNLIALEETGYILQEETLMSCRQARHGLAALQEKLDTTLHPQSDGIMPEVMKHVTPLISLLVKKEKGTAGWFMFGLKLAKSAVDIIKQRK
jgi:hypothetical protein